MSKKSLILYYSQSGNTEIMAKLIEKCTDSDLCEIEALDAYSDNYDEVVKRVHQELECGIDPGYKSVNVCLDDYDVVFVGTPNWGGTVALPLATFLKDHDWSNKVVLPFLSHAGAGKEDIEKNLQTLCKGADVKLAYEVYKEIDETNLEDILQWIHTYS